MACILILNRLIYSSAWYGKEEARVLKTQLESCECDLFDRLQDPQAMNRYFFWLHCYCRYQAVHLTDSMYDVLERAKKAMQSIQNSIKANEESFRVQYIHTFAEKLGKKPEEVEQFPQLFR